MTEVVIVSAVRTAVGRGKADGALASVHPVDLSATVMNEAIRRAGIDPAIIEDVQWGCAMPEASQGLNHARLGWLRRYPWRCSRPSRGRRRSSHALLPHPPR